MSEKEKYIRPAGRKLAEWVTLGISALLVLAVAIYLIIAALRDRTNFIPVITTVLIDQAHTQEARHIVPVEVRNPGHKTLKNVRLRIKSGSEPTSTDYILDYLPEQSATTIYLTLQQDPKASPVDVQAVAYELR